MRRVLTVAGSDSGGGAGIEADIKTISAFGCYACTAITAVTAQNTRGVFGVQVMPADFVALAMRSVIDDIGVDAIKFGMLANAEIIAAVASALPGSVPVVLDPVMVATSGAVLLPEDAVAAMRELLVPLAAIVTPNLPEAAKLTGLPVGTDSERVKAGEALLGMGAQAALIKGGHGDGAVLSDFLVTGDGVEVFSSPRIVSRNTHGTGCTLAAGIAAGLAEGVGVFEAVRRARGFLQAAIAAAPGFGRGHGPVNHLITRR